MSEPLLTAKQSGYGGRGYKNLWSEEIVPSITTALGHIDKPGVLRWSLDQMAAWAAVNAPKLAEKDIDAAYGYARWYVNWAKESDFDNPVTDLRNSATGVLNDLAELGTFIHEYIEADLCGFIEPEIVRRDQEELVISWLEWKANHDIEDVHTESTVFGAGYAGTADVFWKLDGVYQLTDFKTSRAVRREHVAQLAALGAAEFLAKQVPAGTPDAKVYSRTRGGRKVVDHWVAEPLPPVQAYSVLQIRPDDVAKDGSDIPAFAHLRRITGEQIDAGWDLFQGALAVCKAQARMNQVEKQLSKEVF